MKTLAPIRHEDAYTRGVEGELRAALDEALFDPLVAILEEMRVPDAVDADRENAISSALKSAISTGRIWVQDGVISGKFSAAISRELRALGARFDAPTKTFRIAADALPLDLRDAAAATASRARATHDRLLDFLDAAEGNAAIASIGPAVDATFERIHADLIKQFSRTTSSVEAVEVSADLTPAVVKTLAEEWRNNLDKYIRGFLAEEIPELRDLVQANATAGYRADRLVDVIAARHGVSNRKAAFLADQETSLFVSKFREARYREIGVRQYRWSTSHDDRVRKDHRLLDGTIHSWDSPPVTNRATGARNHPGEDFRCRCVPIAILNLAERANSRSEFRCRRAA